MTVDVSALSLRKISSARTPIGWYAFCPSTAATSTMLRIAGVGSASRPLGSVKHGRRVSRLLVMLTHSKLGKSLSLELSLTAAIGRCLLPAVLGRMEIVIIIRKIWNYLLTRHSPIPR